MSIGGVEGGEVVSVVNRRTAVRGSPTASANTTRFFFGPPLSRWKQLRGAEGTGEVDGLEEEDDEEEQDCCAD